MQPAFNITSLDLLAEAALFCSTHQDTNVETVSCATVPKKRKYYRELHSDDQIDYHNRLNSNSSSGYSSSPSESGSKSPDSFVNLPDYSEPNSPISDTSTFDDQSTTKIAKKSSSTKKTRSSKKSKSSTINLESNVQFNEFVKKSVIITPKIDAKLLNESTSNNIFDDNLKIEVKTPKLTYTLRGMRKRKPSTKTPDYLKSEDYFEKRRRNNEAARRSRNNKNAAIRTSALKLKQLEQEREELDYNFGKEIMIMKFVQEKMENDPELRESVMNLVDEKQLAYFNKVLELK